MASTASQLRRSAPTPGPRQGSEQPFWQAAGARWRRLGGSFSQAGFSFEWHEWHTAAVLPWAESFHPYSVELCLNLQGTGWVATPEARLELGPATAGFFVVGGRPLAGERLGGQAHQFLSAEFSVPFLRRHLATAGGDLQPSIREALKAAPGMTGVSAAMPLLQRHRDLVQSLLRPPVNAAARHLWYESKALEFGAEFFFTGGESTASCTRAERVAAERVARAKAILLERLSEPPSLEELGRRIGCSPFYLSRTFTQETGQTLTQWLRNTRLERAADLLRTGKFNVTEAALEVGYSSLSHFSQAFHELHGCCPGLYPLRTPAQQRCAPARPGRK